MLGFQFYKQLREKLLSLFHSPRQLVLHYCQTDKAGPCIMISVSTGLSVYICCSSWKNLSVSISKVFDAGCHISFLTMFTAVKMWGFLMTVHWTEAQSPEKETFALTPRLLSGAPTPSVPRAKKGHASWDILNGMGIPHVLNKDGHQILKHNRGDLLPT